MEEVPCPPTLENSYQDGGCFQSTPNFKAKA